MTWGTVLADAVALSQRRVLLVAPFIKANVLRRLLECIRADVDVDVVTRWRPEEIASGVSDLDVFGILNERPRSSLRLCDRLHAKYYRVDDAVLLGSANLTGKGLGWVENCNLELLFQSPWRSDPFGAFEIELSSQSVLATEELRNLVELAAASLPRPVPSIAALIDHAVGVNPPGQWFPVTRHPEYLYRAYLGQVSDLTSAAAEQTAVDLARIHPCPSLSSEAFHAAVQVALLQNPCVVAVEQFTSRSRRFGEMRAFLGDQLAAAGIERDRSEAWQTLLRWLLYFFPQRYRAETTRFSEAFSVRR